MKRLFPVLSLIALVAGCGSSSGTKTPDCFIDDDCSSGQCLAGVCKPLSCNSNGDCRGGTSCQAGSCQIVASCTADGECNGWFCVAGGCVQCRKDQECPNGLKCISGTCRSGCVEDRDCPAAAPICDPAYGVCLDCIDDSHCSGGKPRCDTYRGVCVECLGSLDCPAPKVCRDQTCIQTGCAADSECAAPTPHCDTQSGQCFECVSSDHCQQGQICANHQCQIQQTGCSSNDECSSPTPFCSPDHNCVECLQNSDCQGGYHCSGYSCLPGECDDNGDCPQERPLCDTQNDPSRCVQCFSDGDCQTVSEHYCLAAEGRCVQCLRNAHCPADALCAGDHTCRSGFTDCMVCESKRCPSGSFCHQFTSSDGATIVDTGCVRICEDQSDCNKGYYCKPPDGGVDRYSLCLPAYNKTLGTCEAIRDIAASCRGNSDCGSVNVNDAVCVGSSIPGVCTILCESNDHCPGNLVCISDPSEPLRRKICAPKL